MVQSDIVDLAALDRVREVGILAAEMLLVIRLQLLAKFANSPSTSSAIRFPYAAMLHGTTAEYPCQAPNARRRLRLAKALRFFTSSFRLSRRVSIKKSVTDIDRRHTIKVPQLAVHSNQPRVCSCRLYAKVPGSFAGLPHPSRILFTLFVLR
jgi:hypothetical protein